LAACLVHQFAREFTPTEKVPMRFTRPEHQIADMLGRIDAGCSWKADAFFGGGTAIVLGLGEYRRSQGRWEIGEPNPDSERQEFSRSSNGAAPQGGG